MSKEVVLTGLRSNAEFHLGNYLGAILPMIELQKKHAGQYQLNMFIPDLHSFTTPVEHGKLYQQTIENLKVFVAAGLDIEQPDTFIYRQSYIPAHSEMTWILSCFSYFGELSRMTQFKDKAGLMVDQRQVTDKMSKSVVTSVYEPKQITDSLEAHISISAGLFIYPVLMAADILLYGAKWIPVGEDQRQHVEFTRDLALRLNNKFGEIFTVPKDNKKQVEFAGRSDPVRIRSLRNPQKKMSKSIEDPAGTIMLSDKPDEAASKVMSATTDSMANIKYDWQGQPGVTNMLQMIALLAGKAQTEINQLWAGQSNYNQLKSEAAARVKAFLTDFQAKMAQVNTARLMKKLAEDEAAMTKVAAETLIKVQKAVGLRPVGLNSS